MQHRTEPCQKNIRLTILGTLAAVELLMSFSFLGYLHIEPLSITFAYIPVLLAGTMAGVPEAAAIGALFGLASMWKASASYVASFDQLFSPVLSGHPLKSILLSVGHASCSVCSLDCSSPPQTPSSHRYFHICGGLSGQRNSFCPGIRRIGAFFPRIRIQHFRCVHFFFLPCRPFSNFVIAAIVLLGWKAEQSRFWKKYWSKLEKVRSLHLEDRYHCLSLVVLLALVICMAVAVAVYFVQRMEYVLKESGVTLSPADYGNLVHLQIQFMIGILSLMVLVVIFLVFNRRYATYLTNEARTDALTGLLTRKAFFHVCVKTLETYRDSDSKWGYFVMIDVDRFKELNDEFGHPEGDRVLRAIAGKLRDTFDDLGILGRMGGDEFAVLISTPISQAHLENCLEQICAHAKPSGAARTLSPAALAPLPSRAAGGLSISTGKQTERSTRPNIWAADNLCCCMKRNRKFPAKRHRNPTWNAKTRSPWIDHPGLPPVRFCCIMEKSVKKGG